MKHCLAVWLLVGPVFLSGCALQVRAGFESPTNATATAVAQASLTLAVPQLGKIAYTSGGDIWTRDLPDGKVRRLTQDGQNSWPLWSASGYWIAFRKGQQLWMMKGSGMGLRLLGTVQDREGQVAWSPTRDQLAYVDDGGLATVDAGTPDRRQLVPSVPMQGMGVQAIAWSPDGETIAFGDYRRQPASQGLWRVAADGGPARKIYLSTRPLQTQNQLEGWSPDGRYLMAWQGIQMSASLAADGEPLLAVPVASSEPIRVVPAMLTYRSFLAWSPEGGRLALIAGGGRETWLNKVLTVVRLGGSVRSLSDALESEIDPAWSPDSRWIAVAGELTNSRAVGISSITRAVAGRRIWLMAADGSAQKELTRDPSYRDERPLWSADGTIILFVRIRNQQAQLWTMRVDGSDQRLIVDELSPPPLASGYYGHVSWDESYAWWTGRPSS